MKHADYMRIHLDHRFITGELMRSQRTDIQCVILYNYFYWIVTIQIVLCLNPQWSHTFEITCPSTNLLLKMLQWMSKRVKSGLTNPASFSLSSTSLLFSSALSKRPCGVFAFFSGSWSFAAPLAAREYPEQHTARTPSEYKLETTHVTRDDTTSKLLKTSALWAQFLLMWRPGRV